MRFRDVREAAAIERAAARALSNLPRIQRPRLDPQPPGGMIEGVAFSVSDEQEGREFLGMLVGIARWYGLRPVAYMGPDGDGWRVSLGVRPHEHGRFEHHIGRVLADVLGEA